jgi:hypothetical protein
MHARRFVETLKRSSEVIILLTNRAHQVKVIFFEFTPKGLTIRMNTDDFKCIGGLEADGA